MIKAAGTQSCDAGSAYVVKPPPCGDAGSRSVERWRLCLRYL
jgi:hypothetical protein